MCVFLDFLVPNFLNSHFISPLLSCTHVSRFPRYQYPAISNFKNFLGTARFSNSDNDQGKFHKKIYNKNVAHNKIHYQNQLRLLNHLEKNNISKIVFKLFKSDLIKFTVKNWITPQPYYFHKTFIKPQIIAESYYFWTFLQNSSAVTFVPLFSLSWDALKNVFKTLV